MAERKRKRSFSTESSGGTSDSSQMTSAPSNISLKSDRSRIHPLNFDDKRLQLSSAGSAGPSNISLKSDRSRIHPLNFDDKRLEVSSAGSAAPSIISMRSDRSRIHPLNFDDKRLQVGSAESAAPSNISLKSDRSRIHPLNFDDKRLEVSSAGSAAPSIISMRSDRSRIHPINFKAETQSQLTGEASSCSVCKDVLRDPVEFICGHWSCKQCVESDSPADYRCPKCGKTLRKDPDVEEDTRLLAQKTLKEEMQKKFALVSEGNGDQRSYLNTIYTSLYITTGESEGPHEEHEFRQSKVKKQASVDCVVNLSEIFKPLSDEEKPHRTVLMKGVAGIGKSFSVQKFVLDWAEEKANPDVDFVFSLAFRELNLSTSETSLHDLLMMFHPALYGLEDSVDYAGTKIIVILDGLDESRLQLDFDNNEEVTSVREVTSVGNLLVNLIQGNLLPKANLWITSRPAAASQIPARYVEMMTEIRGFTDPQKEEYFRRRFSPDSSLADRITSHIQSSQSLDIMCQIPIFCWISAVLFQEVFGGDEKAEIPQTLTEMMAHFLFTQTKRSSRKYDKTARKKEMLLKTHREFLLKLGKLAFAQLLKNNLIFYEKDLEDCGVDVKEASIYSGFCTTVLREEKVFFQRKVFFFVHLTIQEFFAALYVYDCFINKNTTELGDFLDLRDEEHTLLDLLKMSVDKVLEKKNGHLDFFLRFLLGLMVEPNRRILQGLLTPPDPSQDTEKKILTYLKSIRRKALSPDSCIHIFQTMVEMRDHKVKDEIEEYLKLPGHLKAELTPLHCSALAYMLQVSKNDLEVLDLKSYNTSEEGRRRLIPAVRSSRKALLADCKVTAEWIGHLVFALKFPFSSLRHLDLSNNDLRDSGVKLLCDGLSSQCCKIKMLRLSGCLVTEIGCDHLVSALQANPSHLMELDLSYNHPGDSGKEQLFELKEHPRYKLCQLNFEHGGSHRMKPGFKKYACELTLDHNTAHKNLLLSEGNRKATWVEDEQPYPHHTDRFDHCQTVLCEQGLKERCYLEVEVFGKASIGVTYRSIGRKGDVDDCKLGRNEKSWCLTCSDNGCHVLHPNERVSVPSFCLRSSRVGVYLDWEAGTLSFYRASSDSLTHLYTFREETFSDALYPAAELHNDSSVLFCQLT